MSNANIKTTIDTRAIPAAERHPMIFGAFNQLLPGEALLLINDHDPKPLLAQFQSDLGEICAWNYLERGPEVWQICIRRVAACCA
jgi:uncharacterized protein (DUF2249 family)